MATSDDRSHKERSIGEDAEGSAFCFDGRAKDACLGVCLRSHPWHADRESLNGYFPDVSAKAGRRRSPVYPLPSLEGEERCEAHREGIHRDKRLAWSIVLVHA